MTISDKAIEEHYEWVKRVVDSWPEWKRQAVKEALENSPTRKTPRKPVLGEDDGY